MIHKDSRWTYGSPRIHAELREEGVRCSRKRVARLMRQAGIEGCHRRRTMRTTQRATEAEAMPDLVERNFHAEVPNRLWLSDFTYVPTLAGFLYVAVVLDAFSRRVVGWAMATRPTMQLVIEVLRRPIESAQYLAIRYTERLAEAGAVRSVGSRGDSYDNALAETVVGLYKAELIRWRGPWRTLDQVELATAEWVDWWNQRRLHGAIDYLPPAEFERRWWEQAEGQVA